MLCGVRLPIAYLTKDQVPGKILSCLAVRQIGNSTTSEFILQLWRMFEDPLAADPEDLRQVLHMTRDFASLMLTQLDTLSARDIWMLFHLHASLFLVSPIREAREASQADMARVDGLNLSALPQAGLEYWKAALKMSCIWDLEQLRALALQRISTET